MTRSCACWAEQPRRSHGAESGRGSVCFAGAPSRNSAAKWKPHNFVRNFEVLLRRRDGTMLSAMESSFATRDSDGKIERYQGFLLDVTEKKQAEDEIRRRNRELNALNAMAMIASQSFDLDEILNLTLRQMILLLDARAGSIYVADAGRWYCSADAPIGAVTATESARVARDRVPGGIWRSGDPLPHRGADCGILAPSAAAVAEFIRAESRDHGYGCCYGEKNIPWE